VAQLALKGIEVSVWTEVLEFASYLGVLRFLTATAHA
jgi:hypothetical protein